MNSYPIERRPWGSTSRLSSCRQQLGVVLLLVAGVAQTGCRRSEETHSYIVSKEAPPPAATTLSAEPTDRMLAAILPAGGQAWFLKVVGPMAAVDAQDSQVQEFFSSVRPASGDAPPEWKLPEGWTEQKGTGMRAATITIPATGKPLELTVIALPWTADPSELLSNVNRWRGQMNLAPVDIVGLAACTHESKAGDATLTVVDLRGQFKSSGMSAPFAGGGSMMGGPMMGSSGSLPAGHPPIDSSSGQQTATLHYTTPDSWQEQPASGMRKAAFQIVDGDRQALVTVIDFPATAGPAIGDALANVNRWRAEVGLEPLAGDALSDAVETVEIDGQDATFTAALPEQPDDQETTTPERGTLAAMVANSDRIWFFKLTGDRDLVATQKDKFRSFLESVQFDADEGADDGN